MEKAAVAAAAAAAGGTGGPRPPSPAPGAQTSAASEAGDANEGKSGTPATPPARATPLAAAAASAAQPAPLTPALPPPAPPPSDGRRHRAIYEAYAASYPSRFRAAIDYQFAEEPRQVYGLSALVLFCVCVGLAAERVQPGVTGCVRLAYVSIAVSLGVYCFLQSRDGLMVRPHPGFWRLVHAAGLMHLLTLAALAALPVAEGRRLVRLFFPGLAPVDLATGATAFAGTLDLQCELSARTVKIQMRKLWFASHVFGWFGKMCIFRDWLFCVVLSFAFEAVELSFQWLIPELKECWWDSLLLDVLVSNTAGMLVGVAALKLFRVSCYDWSGLSAVEEAARKTGGGAAVATGGGGGQTPEFDEGEGEGEGRRGGERRDKEIDCIGGNAGGRARGGGGGGGGGEAGGGGGAGGLFSNRRRRPAGEPRSPSPAELLHFSELDAARFRAAGWRDACECRTCNALRPSRGDARQRSRPPRLAAAFMRFQPFTWTKFRWSFFSSPARLMHAFLLLALSLLTELNAFLIMYALDIPASHPFHVYRVTMLCFLGLSGVGEIYHYVDTPSFRPRRIGHNAWLFLASIAAELAVLSRYGRHRFVRLTPERGVVVPWAAAAALFAGWSLLHFGVVGPERLQVSKAEWRKLLAAAALGASRAGGQDGGRDGCTSSALEPPLSSAPAATGRSSGREKAAAAAGARDGAVLRSETAERVAQAIARQRRKWGRFFDFAVRVVSVPPACCALPLLALARFYAK